METTQDLTSIKKQLPRGAIAEIARRAKVLPPTVYRALTGDKRSSKLPDIIIAAVNYLDEYRAKEKEADKVLNRVLSE